MNEPTLSRRQVLGAGCAAMIPARFARQQKSFIQGVSGNERNRIAKLGSEFQRKYELPGISLAMSYRGKLKLLACFGRADKDAGAGVQPQHQFRIASVSKPITSVTILRLAEQGKLSLDDTVFGAGGRLRHLLNNSSVDAVAKARIQRITLRHLLEHTAGGWTNQRGEAPMFAPAALGLSHSELITWTLKNVPLKNEPGERYAYSNFGYCLLGRVIEAVTAKSYEDAVKQLVLNPVGAKATVIGKNLRDQRRSNEVVYYDKYDPYGKNMDVARMDSHGGWISTATDLVRFVQSVDGFGTPRDILTAASLKTMTTPAHGNYALGWNVNASKNWWHGGSFNGGSSILARIHDGHCWAVLVNTRSYEKGYASALDEFPWSVKRAVKSWGRHNFFGAV